MYILFLNIYVCACVIVLNIQMKKMSNAQVCLYFIKPNWLGRPENPEPGRPYRLSMRSDREFWTVMHLDWGKQVKPKADNQELLSHMRVLVNWQTDIFIYMR